MFGIDISSLLGLLVPTGIGGFIGFLSKSGRVKSKADAYKAMAEAYEYRIESLHKVVETCNETISELQQRVAELNHALDDKTDMIRKYVEEITKALQTVAGKEREIAELRVALEYVLEWRCEHPDCNDPRGRRPPNGKLCGQTFRMPRIVELYRERSKSSIQLPKDNQTT